MHEDLVVGNTAYLKGIAQKVAMALAFALENID